MVSSPPATSQRREPAALHDSGVESQIQAIGLALFQRMAEERAAVWKRGFWSDGIRFDRYTVQSWSESES